ncbi:hypothetical protein [Streptomyces sp. 891-h]|uniref:hypothetical protein n=1 Tax=Streptomyces sp. 891-h TaxID=2720714 RepID=UPI001FAB0C94|nr:hypothetical protein [Streptomyces sp. 891-h]UNZ18955.1 sugar porter family MFS transporter [Streptomyces sp. 891-h]
MYGPAAPQPPQPPPGPGAAGAAGAGARSAATRALLVRIAFASFPLWSLGLLTWVPSLRFAVLRRRPRDWAVFAGACVLTAVYIVLLFVVPETKPGEEGNAQLAAGVYIVLLIGGAVVHAVLADRPPRAGRPKAAAHTAYAPAHTPPPAPGPYAPGPQASGPYPAGPYAPGSQPPSQSSSPPPPPPTPPYGGASPYAPTVTAAPQPDPASSTSPRMRQVASELDELGELLRQQPQDGRQRPDSRGPA